MKRVLVTLAVAGGLFWISQTAAYAQAPNAACNLLPPQERALCNQRINERRAVCDRQTNPQARQACLNSFNQLTARLNNCPRVAPDQRDDCVRAALGLRPPAPPVAAACNLLPPNERGACNQRINERRAVCDRQTNPQARQACLNSFNQLTARLNSCPRVAPDQRDDCVRAALGLQPPPLRIDAAVCNLLPSAERAACARSISERRAVCARNPNPQARDACLRSLATRLNSCPRVAPDQRDDCVRAALGLRPAGPAAELTNVRNQLNSLRNRARALCGQLPPAQRPACIRSLYPPAPPTN